MCITEYDEERTFAEQREEGRAEGRAEGKVEGMLHVLIGLIKDGTLSLADAARRADMSIDEFQRKAGLKN